MSMVSVIVHMPVEMKAFLDKQPNRSAFLRELVANYQKTLPANNTPLSDDDIETINTLEAKETQTEKIYSEKQKKWYALPREERNQFFQSIKEEYKKIVETQHKPTIRFMNEILYAMAEKEGLI